ncbi:hypothetical protein V1511DRAFT_458656 [Dipodascopsis uninucleata]
MEGNLSGNSIHTSKGVENADQKSWYRTLSRTVAELLIVIIFYVPTWLFGLLGMSFNITLSFSTLLLILLCFGAAVWSIVRYKYLNVYSRLPVEPHRTESKLDMLFIPDALTESSYSKPLFSSYLDEFFQGIKIFGYLEKPIFHELTRQVQTRKFIAGDTIPLEDEEGFCIVVDGLVQIYAKQANNDSTQSSRNAFRQEIDSGYSLLTEVKNGAPMSSLFTILSLFTEDIKLSTADGTQTSSSGSSDRPDIFSTDDFQTSPGRSFPTNQDGSISPVTLSESIQSAIPRSAQHGHTTPRKRPQSPIDPDIIARATVDSTIAVIPAESFRRLTRKYPKSAAHIVRVILTRFERVTFQTGHHYLGLTSEVLKTEIYFNNHTGYELPNFLGEDAVSRVKAIFEETSNKHSNDSLEQSIFHNGVNTEGRSHGRQIKALDFAHNRHYQGKGMSSDKKDITSGFQQRPSMESQRRPSSSQGYGVDHSSPGDLLSSVSSSVTTRPANSLYPQLSFQASNGNISRISSPSSLSRSPDIVDNFDSGEDFEHIGEDEIEDYEKTSQEEIARLKKGILECIFKALGISMDSSNLKAPLGDEASPPLSATENRPAHSTSLLSANSRHTKYDRLGPFPFEPGSSTFADDDSVSSSFINQSGSTAVTYADIESRVEILYFKAGASLVKESEPNKGLYYLIDGFLDVCKEERSGVYKTIYTIKPGGIGGYLGFISGYRSFVNIRATTDSFVGFLPKDCLERLADRQPSILLTMAKRLTNFMSKLILNLDFGLEWVQVGAGEVVYRQGEEADSIFIVSNGRMRAIRESDGNVSVVSEYGQGDSVGELEVLTSTKRPNTLHAVRDTELIRFPRTLFESLSMRHPEIMIQISRVVASRMNALLNIGTKLDDNTTPSSSIPKSGDYRTIAVIPVTGGLPVKEFGARLAKAFASIEDSNMILDQSAILNHLGRHAFNKFGKLKLSGYLTDLEERYRRVLYITDTSISSPWTQTCISQADCILLLAYANGDPSIGEYERLLIGMKTTARKELVLIHDDRYVPPGQTNVWLKNRIWIHAHHHIQMPFREHVARTPAVVSRLRNLKSRVQSTLQSELQKYVNSSMHWSNRPVYSSHQSSKNDFTRLARILSGRAVGLVLGGGGARGISHLGVIQALEEAGIPIDIVGGTSIGSFIGGLYARDADMVPIYGRVKKFCGRIASLWRMLFDLTYPAMSYTTGHEFNRGIWKAFGDSRIEDFWLQYYNNTTNITHSRMEIHTSGYAWRYIRASMSLAGLLPPLTDDGSMLLDGGYVDNLTVSHMKSLGADVLFAVDVGSVDDTTPMTYGDSLSGFWVLINRWNPFSRHPNIPSMADIQARLAYVSSVGALERAKQTPGCVYMRPPIEGYGTLDFGKFEEIYQVGYKFAKEFIEELIRQEKFPKIAGTLKTNGIPKKIITRRNSI